MGRAPGMYPDSPWKTPMRIHSPRLLLSAVIVLTGCAGPMPPPSAGPSAAESADRSADASTATPRPTRGPDSDLELLLNTLEGVHPEPFHTVARDEFVAALAAYERHLPSLSPSEAAVELMRVWALLSRERDGHQFAFPVGDDPMLPIQVYEFEEGLFVTAAMPPHEGLVGGRVAAIGGVPVDEVLELVEPLVPRDGPATLPAFRPILLLRTTVLTGLGIAEPGAVSIRVQAPDGEDMVDRLEPISPEEHAAWAGQFGAHRLPLDGRVRYLADDETLTVTELENGRTLYLRYRFVGAPNVRPARERIEGGGVERLILDLRQNPGGDNGTYGSLLDLVREFAALRPGGLVVLTDRVTFSAAANLATEIEGSTDAVFVGEPMGGGLNFWDDVMWVELRRLPIPMRVAVSRVHWEFAAPDDPRLTIEPDVPVAVTAADHFAGRDPALEAALASGR
jgi:hypothetical protein